MGLTGLDVENRCAVDEVGTAKHERIASNLEQTGHTQADRARPVGRARRKEANLVAAESWRVNLRLQLRRLSTLLAELGGVGVLVEIIEQPHMRESLEPLESCRLDHVSIDPERRASCRRKHALARCAPAVDKAGCEPTDCGISKLRPSFRSRRSRSALLPHLALGSCPASALLESQFVRTSALRLKRTKSTPEPHQLSDDQHATGRAQKNLGPPRSHGHGSKRCHEATVT